MKRIWLLLACLLPLPTIAHADDGRFLRWKRCGSAEVAVETRIAACRQLIKDNVTGVLDAYILLGEIYIEQHDMADAIDIYTRAVDNYGGRYPLMLRGEAYAISGDYPHALADANAVVASHGDLPDALSYRCWIRGVAAKELDAGLADCDAALKERPGSANVLDSRGLVLLRMARFDDAIAAYDAAVKINGKLASALYMRGILLQKKGVPSGDDDILAALKLDPKIATLYDRLNVVRLP